MDKDFIMDINIINTKTYKPMGAWILVRKTVPKVQGVIELADISQNARAKYYIEAAGPEAKVELDKGTELVLTPDTWAVPVEPDHKELFLIREENICGVILA